MAGLPQEALIAKCCCGSVEFASLGAPITTIVCYCDDCQKGGRQIEALPSAQVVREPDGGTGYILFSKDRVRCTRGQGLLRRYKIRERSATNRVVAACCNSAMLVSFDDIRPWVSLYRRRVQANAPAVRMRIYTKFRPEGSSIPSDAPSYSTFPLTLPVRLVCAKVALVLRGPFSRSAGNGNA